MCNFMPSLEDSLDRCRIAFHTPGGQEKGLSHAELSVQVDEARHRDFGPIPQHGQSRHAGIGGGMVGQVQNTVSVHIEGKGHGAPGAIWPGDWVFNHHIRSCWQMSLSTK